MNRFRLCVCAILGVAASVTMTSCGDDDDGPRTNPVDAYIDALDVLYPGAPRHAEWERERGWIVASFDDRAGYDTDVWFSPTDAAWAMTHVEYEVLDNVTPQVLYAFEGGRYAGWNIEDIDYYQRPDASFYVIEVEAEGERDVSVFYYDNGSEIKTVAGSPAIYPDTPL